MRTRLGNDASNLLLTIDVDMLVQHAGYIDLTFQWGTHRDDVTVQTVTLSIEDLATEGYVDHIMRYVGTIIKRETAQRVEAK